MNTLTRQLEGSLALEEKPFALTPSPAPEAISPNPTGILEIAISRGATIDQLTKLLEFKEKWDEAEERRGAVEARKAFVSAMAEFKRSSIRIIKDKDNHQYKSKYVSLGNLVNTVTPYLSDHGLSVRWDLDQSAGIKVICIVTHKLGHSESVSMVCPPDKSGAKNPIQEIKSAITYAKACTFESICGLASTDGNVDDDGSGGKGSKRSMDREEFDRYAGLIAAAENVEVLKQRYMAACKDAKDAGDDAAIKEFAKIKDKRYREVAK